jgi:hypothetical protein
MPRRSKFLALAASAALCSLVGLAAAPSAWGEDAAQAAPAPAPPANTLSLNGDFTNTLTTAYITRGVLLENQGIIYQNVGDLYFTLNDSPKVSFMVGMFNSVHDEKTDNGAVDGSPGTGTVKDWYEFDFWLGFNFSVTKELAGQLLYQEFHSPNGGFGACKNVQLKFTYDDSGIWKKENGFKLAPYALAFWELDGKAGTGDDEGLYIETGIAPSWTFGSGDWPLTVSVPITAGFGFSDFYEDDEFFGFASVGIVGSMPLKFMSKYGSWTAFAGGYYYLYGPGVDGFNQGAGAHSDDDFLFVGQVGVGLQF